MPGYRNEAERRAEVARWRASGQSVPAYSALHGMSEETLRRWRKEDERRRAESAPEFVRVELVRPIGLGLTLEIGRARVRVESGFDASLLREVVKALSEEST